MAAVATVGIDSRARGMSRGGADGVGGGGAGRFRGLCTRRGGTAQTGGGEPLGQPTGGGGAARLFRPISAGQ